MKAENCIIKTLAAFALICGLSVSARAQIGSGWTPSSETYIIQTSSNCTATPNGSGGGTFTVPSGSGRAEFRFNNLSTSTTEQFQGTLVVNSIGGTKICVKQTFGPAPSTPWQIIDVLSSGQFEEIEGGAVFGSYTVGVPVQLNTIYDPSADTVDLYINGVHEEQKSGNAPPHYNKFGAYVSDSGTGPLNDTWTNIQFWTGGSSSGGGGTTVATPTFNPGGGTYSSAQSVSISDSTSGATIYYTTNGSTPTTSSTVYSSPIPVSSGTVTIKALGAKSGDNNSSVASATYTISSGGGGTVATPTFSPGGGTYSSAQSVAISDSTSGATIYYTTNGSTPTTSSTVYSGPISVSSGTVTIEAIGAKSGDSNSSVASATYTISSGGGSEPAPAFSEPGGTYTKEVHVRISDSDSGASIYYTTDGSTPTQNSTPNPDHTIEFMSTTTLKAIAFGSGGSSPVTSATYTITP